MNNELFEILLNECESDSLDFKLNQYLFNNGSTNDKSELLKDILAFTNSWRRTDAYILIGVDELPNGQGNPIGIMAKDHLKDNQIQQFVNCKTIKPITFSYSSFNYLGKEFGIIHIPLQDRPLYLKKDYGKVKKDTIYIRRGSSTDIADPNEISRMGISFTMASDPTEIELLFGNYPSKIKLGKSISLESKKINTPEKNLPYKPSRNTYEISLASNPNENFFLDLYEFYYDRYFFSKVFFVLQNDGSKLVVNPRVKIIFPKSDGIRIKEFLRSEPHENFDFLSIPRINNIVNNVSKKTIYIDDLEEAYNIELLFQNIQPGSEEWISDPLFIGCEETKSYEFICKLTADNLSKPLKEKIKIDFKSVEENIPIKILLDNLGKIRKHHYDEFKNT